MNKANRSNVVLKILMFWLKSSRVWFLLTGIGENWVLLLTAGTPVLGDLRDPFETILTSLLDMDLGANPLRDLYTGNRNLKSILKFTRGQWRDFKTCVMCAFILLSVSARAAALICSLAGVLGKSRQESIAAVQTCINLSASAWERSAWTVFLSW